MSELEVTVEFDEEQTEALQEAVSEYECSPTEYIKKCALYRMDCEGNIDNNPFDAPSLWNQTKIPNSWYFQMYYYERKGGYTLCIDDDEGEDWLVDVQPGPHNDMLGEDGDEE